MYASPLAEGLTIDGLERCYSVGFTFVGVRARLVAHTRVVTSALVGAANKGQGGFTLFGFVVLVSFVLRVGIHRCLALLVGEVQQAGNATSTDGQKFALHCFVFRPPKCPAI